MEDRKTLPIVLLVIMYMSVSGSYLNNDITFEYALLYGLIDMIICSFVLMIIPLCFRIKNKDLLSYKKGKKICTYNSWAFFGISMLLTMMSNGLLGVGGVGALFYYFINMNFFVYPKDYKKEEIKDNKENYSLSLENEKVEKDPSLTYGEDIKLQKTDEEIQLNNLIEKLEDETKAEEITEHQETPKEKVIDNKKTVILYIIIGVLTIVFLGVIIYAINISNDYKAEIKELESQITRQKTKISRLEDEVESFEENEEEYQTDKEILEFFEDNIVFVIDGYGNYYYTYDQMATVTQGIGRFTYWAYNKEQAISKGYKKWK